MNMEVFGLKVFEGQCISVVYKYTVQIINPSSEREKWGYRSPSEIIKLSSVTGYRLRERDTERTREMVNGLD